MLLVIDVGNSNIVAGVYQDSELLVHWRFSTDRSKTADEYGILLSSMFGYSHVSMNEVTDVIISAVEWLGKAFAAVTEFFCATEFCENASRLPASIKKKRNFFIVFDFNCEILINERIEITNG